jgi:SAM-dependent methyltransferase
VTIQKAAQHDGLALMIERIAEIRTPVFFALCEPMLASWLGHIGYHRTAVSGTVKTIREAFTSAEPIVDVEEQLHHLFTTEAPLLANRLQEEEVMVFGEIDPYILPQATVIDVGCGSGGIAERLAEAGRRLRLVDVVQHNRTNLPFTLYDGKVLPFSDGEFSVGILLTVLHHCDDPDRVLTETARVAKKLVVIESVYTNDRERQLNMFFDWLWNRVVYQGINVPFNFDEPGGWELRFRAMGLKVEHSLDLGYDSPMTPEHHWLFVLGQS